MMNDIAVLIPCYNEAMTLKKVIDDCKKYIPNAKVYVYDNNSTDESSKIAKDAGAIVRYERKQGKGNVVRTMFREVDAKCYILVDADDTYSLANAQNMCDKVLNESYDMVIGDRLSSTYFNENKRAFHNVGNKIVLYAINYFFNTDIKDVMTGYRALSYNFVKTFPVLSKGFEIETEMTIHAAYHNMNICNEVIDYKDRPATSPSKLNTISDGIKVLKTIFGLYKNCRPIYFFSYVSLILIAVASIFFIPIFMEYLHTGYVKKIPTLIVCGFVFVSAILLFFSGLILSTFSEKEKKDFEFKLQLFSHIGGGKYE